MTLKGLTFLSLSFCTIPPAYPWWLQVTLRLLHLTAMPPWAAVNLLALLPRFGQAWPPEHALLLLHLACAPRPGLQPRGQGQGAQVDEGEGPLADRVWVQPHQGRLYRPDLTVEQ
ncbi:hypothetical protein HaLaN_18927 [Haematococcus lacustris]|uniref:Uncharacterized protein n=1 Tax=Haematococcus lacustris TaxID=44745 RepID=A0A699ZPM1_HAELA|nr:hypothetical protein HaLaN_18927 [Haematococcus lacustris]